MDQTTKKYVMIGGAVSVAALLAWWLYEQHANAAAAAMSTTTDTTAAGDGTDTTAETTTADAPDASGYGEEDYGNPYGMTPEEMAAQSSSAPRRRVVMRQGPRYLPASPSASGARCPSIQPVSFAAYLAAPGEAWLKAQPLAAKQKAYATYLQRWHAGMYGGPAVGCPGHLGGLGRRRYGGGSSDQSGDGFDSGAGGGYYGNLVLDNDID